MIENTGDSPQAPAFAHIKWGEDGQPTSSHFGDVYFSRHNGLAETRHVFLASNQLTERFAQLGQNAAPKHFTIAETGFGTGLNFLAAWQLWLEQAPDDAQLHFISVEKFPVNRRDLTRALALWPELASLSQQLLAAYPSHLGPGIHRLHFAGRVNLTLIINDAACGFSQLLPSIDTAYSRPDFRVDAWFLDGFAPSKNPQMWSDELFAAIAQLSGPKTTAATFSAAGIVKRGLQAAGFRINKTPGFGRKREMIQAAWQQAPTNVTPGKGEGAVGVVQRATHPAGVKTALVIGAGLAGCHTARALAERGWKVLVIERRHDIAQEGSGNPQGLLYAKLSHRDETLPRWNLTALNYAQQYYRPYWQKAANGQRSGLIQLADTERKSQALTQTAVALGQSELCRLVSATEATELAGVELSQGGLYFPGCGWFNPHALCESLLDHPAITLRTDTPIASLERHEEHWQTLGPTGTEIAQARVVIMACAHSAQEFSQSAHLPLKPIRGQVSFLPASDLSAQLKTALCSRGYIAPSTPSGHCVGATFNLGQSNLALNQDDHIENLEHLRAISPELHRELAPADSASLEGRAAFRCTTPDYLPVVGPLVDAMAAAENFAGLAQNARRRLDTPAPYWPGLYINCGHGSRGLAYTPLAAEFLASLINREPPPLERALAQALHPARFLLRQIIRGQ
ncbi:bifunctional tRNA (5-methylaminomethyl-2-thiouridine)(34)-methyltransferase MnmD/FAD-dependent 5-carboxymethylaminomethyl-2-thiouridine(34) oxidoreductase MnmC [Gilvimarinus sp. 1_MG-2023]|uniref:bifunctional tRNA (5-methylaminomethyl-2-thiouridine)(34)-methyltransferase MnmD/FAD-dependent 5-carboxymethylaminomethyl-2-thiouridine(34) oxidoreductase MnmC n=1 Tax=Gilvimarinus sp. 1_MG-2023 TaxID=3062638 RepID=UPI0026E309D5|nr:bifunctional tRNA (5-methylaminomethyl-2-thiouridine)(34)-methyltransferase MnmD/FAD-dependent 5-carboxymethylaminomethyl-2-thiouridine(34) oxidoreductase MnmC [Gilvimarinus sp. 1_MG-2023]MDO6747371.1 bifunctional tRNA (5-methylaminomethyl-2-thiouridine)(34)-methyltransferase MnmD/FAD-dependent 5-carboxymethylaminomethyl-2-thiouridine(34) oxidoreductase MnmC [Gilvimarinus sp. 1_MG-2023]